MRTAQICPTCATYTNAVCVIYDGTYLSNINVSPGDDLEIILASIDSTIDVMLASFQPLLGFTPENVANKSTSVIIDQASNTKYPSVKAVFDWVVANFTPVLGFTPEDVANKSTNIVTDQASNTKYPSVKAVFDWATATFEPLLGFTPENVANKSTNIIADQASNTKYPSVKSVYDWVVGNFQTTLGFTPENVANKSTDNTLGGLTPSNTLYPTQKAVKDYVDAQGASYKVCTLNIDFDGANYTIENTFEDTIGVTISTISTQRFKLTSTGNFTLGKVCVTPMLLTSQNPGLVASVDWTFAPTVNDITLRVTNLSTGALTTPTSKGSGVQWILEVRVYP